MIYNQSSASPSRCCSKSSGLRHLVGCGVQGPRATVLKWYHSRRGPMLCDLHYCMLPRIEDKEILTRKGGPAYHPNHTTPRGCVNSFSFCCLRSAQRRRPQNATDQAPNHPGSCILCIVFPGDICICTLYNIYNIYLYIYTIFIIEILIQISSTIKS